jgi:hypothetical protein
MADFVSCCVDRSSSTLRGKQIEATESDNFFREPRAYACQATLYFESEAGHEVKAWR